MTVDKKSEAYAKLLETFVRGKLYENNMLINVEMRKDYLEVQREATTECYSLVEILMEGNEEYVSTVSDENE